MGQKRLETQMFSYTYTECTILEVYSLIFLFVFFFPNIVNKRMSESKNDCCPYDEMNLNSG